MKKILYIMGIGFVLFNFMFLSFPTKVDADFLFFGLDNKEYNRRTAKQIIKLYYDDFISGDVNETTLRYLHNELLDADYDIKVSGTNLSLIRSSKTTDFLKTNNGSVMVNIDDTSEFFFYSDNLAAINNMLTNYDAGLDNVETSSSGLITVIDLKMPDIGEPDYTANDDNYDGKTTCEIVAEIYNALKYIVAILLVLFVAMDLGKTVMAGDEEKMKTAQKNIVVRIGAAASLFILPFLVTLIMQLLDMPISSCIEKF